MFFKLDKAEAAMKAIAGAGRKKGLKRPFGIFLPS